MTTSKLEAPAFLTPATCFALACGAFSLVALSTIWRNASNTSTPVVDEKPLSSRPSASRRVTADSLYAETRDEDNDEKDETRVTNAPPTRQSQVAELVLLSARVAQLLRLRQEEQPQEGLPVVNLLSELSILTTSLCRLQHEVLTKPTFLNQSTLVACFDATSSSLQATLRSLEASLNGGIHSQGNFLDTAKHLKDQRPMLGFLLESTASQSVPPTPPSELAVEATLKQSSEASLDVSPPLDESTGITPRIDEGCWAQPPPYSPPASGSSAALAIKADEKSDAKAPIDEAPESEPASADVSALSDAVTANDSAALVDLLAAGADPNAPSGDLQRTALHHAAHLNSCACIGVLLRYGGLMSIEDAKGDTAVHLAAWAGHVEALSVLLTHGADVDWLSGRDGYSPLWCAISAYEIDAARLLLKHGARVSLRSASGTRMMPLHQAAVTGQTAMCELLLERGAQLDCVDDDMNTPLHYAAAAGSASSVKVLLNLGAQIEAREIHGLTPVSWAAHKGRSDALEVLLDFGASLNCKADGGAKPLHLAASRGHVTAVRLLLERGASRKSRAEWDSASGTALDMAKAKGHERVAKLLRK